MKQLLKRLPKRMLAGVMAFTLVAGLVSGTIAVEGADRPTKAWTGENTAGFDYVTFNSFTGVGGGIGDERDFQRGVQVGRDSVWADPVSNVEQEAEIEAKVYIHNNADPSLNDAPGNPGIAKNVNVRVAIPTGFKQSQQSEAFISADNARPGTVSDTLTMTGADGGFFELDYIEGSAKLLRDGAVVRGLDDSLVTTGVNLGDQRGCTEYVQEVTYRMKVKMPQYGMNKQVRHKGQTAADWKENVTAKVGDKLEWSIKFQNIGVTTLNNVAIVDNVPAGLTVVPGSVSLSNTNFPNGTTDLKPDPIQANGRQINVNAGSNYLPLTAEEKEKNYVSAQLIFETTVGKPTEETCGQFSLVNEGFVTPEGFGTLKDTASVTVEGPVCVTPNPNYSCDLLKIEKTTDRTIRIADFKTSQSNGATFKHVVINWGDTTTPLTTNNAVGQTHTYASDGTYNIVATATFTVNGEDKTATSKSCEASVSYTTAPTTPVTPTTPTTPTTLPVTGAGDIVGMFAAITIAGAVAHRFVYSRR